MHFFKHLRYLVNHLLERRGPLIIEIGSCIAIKFIVFRTVRIVSERHGKMAAAFQIDSMSTDPRSNLTIAFAQDPKNSWLHCLGRASVQSLSRKSCVRCRKIVVDSTEKKHPRCSSVPKGNRVSLVGESVNMHYSANNSNWSDA